MKKLLLTLILAAGMTAAMSAETLVVYFSWGGTTERMAQQIAAATGADLFKIETKIPYPANYTPTTEAAKKEFDSGVYPELKSRIPDFDRYDTFFIGCPVWWHTAPMAVQGLLQDGNYNFAGTTVIPFCTYAATYRDETLAKIVELTPQAKHLEGFGTTNPSARSVNSWLKKIGQIK